MVRNGIGRFLMHLGVQRSLSQQEVIASEVGTIAKISCDTISNCVYTQIRYYWHLVGNKQ